MIRVRKEGKRRVWREESLLEGLFLHKGALSEPPNQLCRPRVLLRWVVFRNLLVSCFVDPLAQPQPPGEGQGGNSSESTEALSRHLPPLSLFPLHSCPFCCCDLIELFTVLTYFHSRECRFKFYKLQFTFPTKTGVLLFPQEGSSWQKTEPQNWWYQRRISSAVLLLRFLYLETIFPRKILCWMTLFFKKKRKWRGENLFFTLLSLYCLLWRAGNKLLK